MTGRAVEWPTLGTGEPRAGRVRVHLPHCGYCLAVLSGEEFRALGSGEAADHWPCGRLDRLGSGVVRREAFPAVFYCEGMGV